MERISMSQIPHRQTSGEGVTIPVSVAAVSAVSPTRPDPNDQEVENEIINTAPDDGVNSIQSLLEQLKPRGKGRYFCPHGKSCDKGGVTNGQLKEFNRNSDF